MVSVIIGVLVFLIVFGCIGILTGQLSDFD